MIAPWADVWPDWLCEKRIGQGSCGTVYQAVQGNGEAAERAAIKVIRIPQSEAETEALLSEGMTEEESKEYYGAVVEDLLTEVSLSSGLRDHRNIVRVEDYAVEPRPDGLGASIFIRMELLTPLSVYLSDKTLSEEEVVRLGQDICRALTVCHTAGVLHRDVKPENIFIDPEGNFKLGDFGIARRLEHASTYMTRVGTPFYAAPEVALSTKYDGRADIYSLGLVLYRLLNHNRLPFMEGKRLLTPADRSLAMERRRSGESLPAPAEASERLADVIRKACAFKPEDRYQTAEEFYEALTGEEKKKAVPFWRNKGIVAAALAVIALGIAGFGWSRGWFTRVQRPEAEPVREETFEMTDPTEGSSTDRIIIPADTSSATEMTAGPTEDTVLPENSGQTGTNSARALRTPKTSDGLSENPPETTSAPESETLTSLDETEPAEGLSTESDIPTTALDPTTTAEDPATTAPDPTETIPPATTRATSATIWATSAATRATSTAAPTTVRSSTAAPTTKAPTTIAPTTKAPTPTTAAHTTAAPTTEHVHKWGAWQTVYEYGDPDRDPCNSGGYKYRICSSCHEEERQEMPAPGHQMEWVVVEEPTCSEFGLKKYICSRCHLQEDEAEIPVLTHTFNGTICTRCGRDLFLWETNYEGTACSITGINPGMGVGDGIDIINFSEVSFTIPPYHNGLPITDIVLWDALRMKALTLPETAKRVSIDKEMICYGGTLTVPGNVDTLEICGSIYGVFKLILGEGVREVIGNGCKTESLTLPNSIQHIEGISVKGDLVIGTGLSDIGVEWDGNVSVRSGNPYFKVKGNCLIRQADQTIINTGRNFDIPADGSVKRIIHLNAQADGAWTDVVIPEGIETMDSWCVNNKWVVLHLPRSLTVFEYSINYSGQNYRYAGTKEQLKAIFREQTVSEDALPHFNVICSDGKLKSATRRGENGQLILTLVPTD